MPQQKQTPKTKTFTSVTFTGLKFTDSLGQLVSLNHWLCKPVRMI